MCLVFNGYPCKNVTNIWSVFFCFFLSLPLFNLQSEYKYVECEATNPLPHNFSGNYPSLIPLQNTKSRM